MGTSASTAKLSIEQIAERITDAVMENRLPPGIKLVEEKLANAFGVSRTKIRQALTMLAQEGLVTMHHNRGAFVACPSTTEAKDLFATRRLVEPEIIRNVIERACPEHLDRLKAHLAKETEARHQGDRRRIIRLSGQFHMLLARISGNSFIEKLMAELCPLTCLIIALFDGPQAPACLCLHLPRGRRRANRTPARRPAPLGQSAHSHAKGMEPGSVWRDRHPGCVAFLHRPNIFRPIRHPGIDQA